MFLDHVITRCTPYMFTFLKVFACSTLQDVCTRDPPQTRTHTQIKLYMRLERTHLYTFKKSPYFCAKLTAQRRVGVSSLFP